MTADMTSTQYDYRNDHHKAALSITTGRASTQYDCRNDQRSLCWEYVEKRYSDSKTI